MTRWIPPVPPLGLPDGSLGIPGRFIDVRQQRDRLAVISPPPCGPVLARGRGK
jgi:hypothetical protein